MISARRVSFAVGGVLFVTLIWLVYWGFQSFQRDVEALQTAGQEDISWSTSQLELELMRFRAELIALEAVSGGAVSTAATLNNRFDILWSRVAIFQRGRVGERLSTYDSETRVVSRLFAAMQAFETQILTLQPGDIDGITAIDAAFQPFSDELREFSRRVTLGEQQISADIRAQLRRGGQRTIVILAAATVLLLVALLIIWRDAHYNSLLAARNELLADEATRASRAKSQFLTMMSHELRTPMNGVLGLLALARQNDLPARLSRTLGQAELSAKRMIGLLTDILDFSALQSKSLLINHAAFSLRDMAAALQQAQAEADTRLRIDVSPDSPDCLLGDDKRIQQVFGHLTGYFLEIAGVFDVTLALSQRDGWLRGDITFHYAEGAAWHPDLLEDQTRDGDENFASGAVGPTIARGLCEQMGGTMTVTPDRNNVTHVRIDIPCDPQSVRRVAVRLELQSNMLRTICETALRGPDTDILTAESKQRPDMVLLEQSDKQDMGKAAKLRQKYPNAKIVAIGALGDETLYDQWLALPIDIPSIRELIKTLGMRC